MESESPETGPIVGDFQLDPDARVFSNPLFPTESVATAIFADPLVNTSDIPEDEEKEYVVTFLDYRAAFDSVSHKFLDEALREAGCSNKTRAIFRGIYQSASAVVRAKMPGDESEATSKPLDVRRGVVQGDIFSPVCFIIALECLMRRSDKDGGVTVLGVLLSRLEFADDAALIDESIEKASERISSIAKGSRELADMEVRIDKTETMFPRDDECGWEVTFNEYEEVEWNHTCEYCGRGFDTKGDYGFTLVHTAR